MASVTASDKALAGRTAVVTGASSGIGRAIAETLGGAGAHVVLGGRTPSAMAESMARISPSGAAAEAHVLDVRAVDEARSLVDRATASTGRLDIMVNNAGVSHPEAILEADPEHWRVMLETNVFALLVGLAGGGGGHAGLRGRGAHREHLVGGGPAAGVRRLRRHQARRELHQQVAAPRAAGRAHQGGDHHARRHRHQLRPQLRPGRARGSW